LKELILKSNIHDYKVSFKNDFSFLKELIEIKQKAFIIDKNVYKLYKHLFQDIKENELYIFNALENKKTLKSVEKIYKFLAKKEAKRNITLISIGGGITQDVTGFVASTLYRGIKWIFIPTTFLAQTDSCIGSKTSLNFKSYKNILGGFYPPNQIYIQSDFLNTLSRKDYFSGIGEIIKFALLKEEKIKDFNSISKMIDELKKDNFRLEAIEKTMQVKKKYIDEDEFDTGKRNLFNYGHCFGHALENSSKYKVPHGIAVTIGMVFANIVAYHRKLISKKIFKYMNNELFLPNIYMKLQSKYFNQKTLLNSMKNDKKRIGKDLTIVIPSSDNIEAIKVHDLTFDEFAKSYKKLLTILDLN
jgi:3-dehydroquinate synthase